MRVSSIFSSGHCGGGDRHDHNDHHGYESHGGGGWSERSYNRGDGGDRQGRGGGRDHEEVLELLGIGIL